MGLKIYREINNNTEEKSDNNILLQFICEVNLWDAEDIFDSCLHYDEDEGEYLDISETYYSTLKGAVEYLKNKINSGYVTSEGWLEEARRCYDILEKAMNYYNDGFYILFNN